MRVLESERLILRPWKQEDLFVLYQYAKDPNVGPMCGWTPHKNIEESEIILNKILMVPYTYAITLKTTNEVIGNISLTFKDASNFAKKEDEAEVGYWLGVPFWNKGYTSEAVKCIITYAFEELGCTKLYSGHFDGNEASYRVQKKCGFHYEQTISNLYIKSLNTFKDLHVLSIYKKDK